MLLKFYEKATLNYSDPLADIDYCVFYLLYSLCDSFDHGKSTYLGTQLYSRHHLEGNYMVNTCSYTPLLCPL